MTRSPGVIGQSVVQRQGPPFGWTDAERDEPALYLSGSVTDPAAKAVRPGSLMAWWAVDLAARLGVSWVRRHAQVPRVAAYDQAQGFGLVREEQRAHARLASWCRWLALDDLRNGGRGEVEIVEEEGVRVVWVKIWFTLVEGTLPGWTSCILALLKSSDVLPCKPPQAAYGGRMGTDGELNIIRIGDNEFLFDEHAEEHQRQTTAIMNARWSGGPAPEVPPIRMSWHELTSD